MRCCFFTNDIGETYVLKAGPEFELLHVNRLNEQTLASPALVGTCFEAKTGNTVWQQRLGEPRREGFSPSPVTVDGKGAARCAPTWHADDKQISARGHAIAGRPLVARRAQVFH